MIRHPAAAAMLLSALTLISCTGAGQPAPSPTIPALNPARLSGALHFADGLPLATPDSFKQLLAGMQGTPVVVNVWASWCAPCKAEMPFLNQVATRYSSQIQFLGVDIGDTLSSARGFISQHHIRYPSVFDPAKEIKASLGFEGQPDTVIYTSSGAVLASCAGPIIQSAFLTDIQQLTGSGSTSGTCA